jgi:hypothetical protein
VAISETDIKLLWGMAGGHCSNPDCRAKVAVASKQGKSYLTGEMAHVVARQAKGPRGDGVEGDDTYENLVLLCPTSHTKVDKAPADFSVEKLFDWKRVHEHWVAGWSASTKFGSTAELMTYVATLLDENKHYFDRYGPKSAIAIADPASSAYAVWLARRLDTILPNNRKIVSALDANLCRAP